MLVTNDKWLVNGAITGYELLKVPVCKVDPIGRSEYGNTPRSLAKLDQTIAKNKIGEIVNLSQFLNCLLWDGLFTERGEHHPMDIYHDICVLAVLSGMEIDKAKRLYSADSTKVLSRLRHYRQNYKKKNGGNLPAFYKYIVGDESADVGENTAKLEAPMSFVHDAVAAFPGRAAYTKTLSLSDLFELDASDAGANDTHKKQNIIKAVKKAHAKIIAMQTAMKDADDDEKLILCDEANEVYQRRENQAKRQGIIMY
ncbi:phage related protein YonO B.subtilis homolog [Candidatus Colimorpha enterica]|uniref:Phage related protein YonO B.subtilis homolog n=1 Tax=Candidatus Colimorpha enterica TaxID=3083063 RepID=R6TXY6_9BACT|nr:phage related protein YonO B.subtilis homolog [Candidatus Colimorpha enterica]